MDGPKEGASLVGTSLTPKIDPLALSLQKTERQGRGTRFTSPGLFDDYGVVLAFPAGFLWPVEGEDDLRADWK